MAFNFFKKNRKQKEVENHLGQFQSDFTENQKRAILVSLYVIANSDGEFHQNEIDVFHNTADLLGYKMKRTVEKTLTDITSVSKDEMVRVLRQMDQGQKDWYIVTAMGMIHADGQVLEIEIKHGMAYFEAIGVTEEYAFSVLEKAEALSKAFNI
jgi:uncharacterized tellurite resistance protein B-like protein